MSDSTLYDGLLQAVKKRRSVRRFKPDPVPDEYIEQIIEVARWAPSGFHTQPWEFVVVKDKALKDKIGEIMSAGMPTGGSSRTGTAPRAGIFRSAPVYIILLGDWRAKVGLAGPMEEIDKRVDKIFIESLAGAFLYMNLAAAALGLASCWNSTVARPEPERKVKELLKIPEPLRIFDMMAVGYAVQPPVPKVIRDFKDMVHYDASGDYRTDEKVLADAKKSKAWCTSAH